MAVVVIAGSALASVAATVAVNTLAYVAGKELMSALQPDIPTIAGIDPTSDQRLSIQTAAPRKIIYGECVVGGNIVGYRKTKDDRDNEYHNFVIHLAGHPCESASLYEIEGKTAAEAGAAVTVNTYLGNQTTAPSELVNTIWGWTANHVGFGQTYAHVKVRIDPDLFPGGVNAIKFKVKGKRIYDPREDSTKGGSGAQRFDQENTWTWSDNPELIGTDYFRFYGAKQQPERRFDFDFIAQSANYCDELVDAVNDQGATIQEKRFTCNGVFNNAMRPGDGLKEILKSFGARHYRSGSKNYIKPAMYTGPADITLYAKNSEKSTVIKTHATESERCEVVRARFVDPSQKYQQTDSTPITSDTYNALTGEHLEEDLTLNTVYSETQAQRLQRYHLEAMRAGYGVSHVEKGLRLDLTAGRYVTYVDEDTLTSQECSIASVNYNTANNTTELTLKNDTINLYVDDFTAKQKPLTPVSNLPKFVDEPITGFTVTDIYDSDYQEKLAWTNPFFATQLVFKWQRVENGQTVTTKIIDTIVRETNYFIGNFKPGIYLVDLRPLDREGNQGPWLRDQQIIINSNDGFTWKVYADDANGSGASLTDESKAYIGLAFNKESSAPSVQDISSQAALLAAGFTFFKGGDSAEQASAQAVAALVAYRFSNNSDGFTANDGALITQQTNILLNATGSALELITPDNLNLNGQTAYVVRLRVRCTTGDLNTKASLFYETDTGAFDPERSKQIQASYQQGEWITITFDLRDLDFDVNWQGLNQWQDIGQVAQTDQSYIDSFIKRIKVRFAQDSTDQAFEVDDFTIGVFGSPQDGQTTFITYHNNAITNTPPQPTGSGENDGWSKTQRAAAKWISFKVSTSVDAGTWGTASPIRGADGEAGQDAPNSQAIRDNQANDPLLGTTTVFTLPTLAAGTYTVRYSVGGDVTAQNNVQIEPEDVGSQISARLFRGNTQIGTTRYFPNSTGYQQWAIFNFSDEVASVNGGEEITLRLTIELAQGQYDYFDAGASGYLEAIEA